MCHSLNLIPSSSPDVISFTAAPLFQYRCSRLDISVAVMIYTTAHGDIWSQVLSHCSQPRSDVTIIEIKIKIAIFRKIEGLKNRRKSILWFFGASVTQVRYRITSEGQQAITCTVWMSLYLRECDHVECRGVYIFHSEHWSKKSRSNRCRILH